MNSNRNLPAPIEQVPAASWYAPPPSAFEPEPEEASLPLSHYFWILKRHRWKILAFVGACVLAAVVVSSRLTPVYESTATVDVDRQTPTGVIGQESMRSTANDTDQFLATQIKLIQSDSVLRPVVEKFGLRQMAGEVETAESTAAQAEDAPVILKRLKVSRPPNTYLLLISYRNADPRLAAGVANAIANSYRDHTYRLRYTSSANLSTFMEKQLEELKAKMERSSSALVQFERELNVINPEEKTSILSARLLQLNTEYTSAQADRVRKESANQSVLGGTLEAAQVSTQGESLKALTERLNDAQAKLADVKTHYGSNHPECRKAVTQLAEVQRQLDQTVESIKARVEIDYRQAVRREGMLQKAVLETKAEFDGLNARSFEYQSLKRGAEADKSLRGAGAENQGGGHQRQLPEQRHPDRRSRAARHQTRLPQPEAECIAGLPVLQPAGRRHGGAERCPRHHGAGCGTGHPDGEGGSRGESAGREEVEGAPGAGGGRRRQPRAGSRRRQRRLRRRGLRRSHPHSPEFHSADFDRRLRSLLVTSASPGEGKSTIAAHLAVSHAQQGHRTLLIDGDLRRPSVHRRFEIPCALGLSDVLVSELPWQDAVVKLPNLPSLDVLPAGPTSRRAADLVGRGLQQVLEEASAQYDLVILDAAPLLGFAEPLQMATVVDGVLVVTRAGETSRKAVASVVASLRRLRAAVIGVVLNEVNKEMSDSYYYGHYSKYFRADAKS
jgi:capsular exopolysaccharide synthesis family protein